MTLQQLQRELRFLTRASEYLEGRGAHAERMPYAAVPSTPSSAFDHVQALVEDAFLLLHGPRVRGAARRYWYLRGCIDAFFVLYGIKSELELREMERTADAA